MNTQKEARRDAEEFARAQMFYGEGAGIRRRLIENSVQAKFRRDPAYGRAFDHALSKQDMAEHASKARKERRNKDAKESISKNARGLATGNYKAVNTGVMVVIITGYVLHKTGLDVKLYNKGKQVYGDMKAKHNKNKTHKIHSI